MLAEQDGNNPASLRKKGRTPFVGEGEMPEIKREKMALSVFETRQEKTSPTAYLTSEKKTKRVARTVCLKEKKKKKKKKKKKDVRFIRWETGWEKRGIRSHQAAVATGGMRLSPISSKRRVWGRAKEKERDHEDYGRMRIPRERGCRAGIKPGRRVGYNVS